MRLFAALLLCLSVATTLSAQDRPNTILVLDGSGSMWGQIDGVAKITIAQEVVTDLLENFPADQGLGLSVYGHRERGSCTDIETVVAPAPGTAPAIAEAVAQIKPLGKTPMTDAVIAAAEALRYTEDTATVILISDGVETCNPDPCAAAKLLEEAGIGFTAHVIGFDVGADAEALAQMQCIAGETGGQFLTAANAAELVTALDTVVQAAEPEPAIVTVGFEARIGAEDGALITDPVTWLLGGANGDATGNPISLELAEGSYDIAATWTAQGATQSRQFIAGAQTGTVVLVFDAPQAQASLTAPDTAPRGSTLQVGWEGPDGETDTIQIGKPGEGYVAYAYTRDGNPATLVLPIETGTYELRYMQNDSEMIASRPIEITDAEISLTAPETAAAGSVIDVGWVGPDQNGDNIQIGLPGDGGYSAYTYTSAGNPVQVQMPAEPGTYELRYVFQDRVIAATRPIEVTEAEVGLTAPAEAAAGSQISVGWTGPNADSDTVQIAPVGGTYVAYAYTATGNPVTLQMPAEPGAYELRYVFQDRETIYTQPITVTEAALGLDAPAAAPAGATIAIGWSGPNAPSDNVQVAEIGGGYLTYAYTADGNPVQLRMPAQPGAYELRYVFQDSETIFTQPITVTPITAQLVAPESAVAGSEVPVGWDGPAYTGDYIAIGNPGETGYLTYAYTDAGNPLTVTAPDTPGTYDIRYVLGQDESVLATAPLTVTAP